MAPGRRQPSSAPGRRSLILTVTRDQAPDLPDQRQAGPAQGRDGCSRPSACSLITGRFETSLAASEARAPALMPRAVHLAHGSVWQRRGKRGCADIAQQTYRVIFGGLFSCNSIPTHASLHRQPLEDDMQKLRHVPKIAKARDGPRKNVLLDICPDCHGDGKINGETCPRCHGAGISPVPPC